MKLNVIVLAMTLMLLATVSAGSYYLYYTWSNSIVAGAREHSESTVKLLHTEINTYLGNQRKPVNTLASMTAISDALISKTPKNLQLANQMLDIFCKTLDALTCYLMDINGTTIASSNRHSDKSFIGKNYSFRPYFKNAISSGSSVYLALGVTSKKRGAYFSHSVMLADKPVGVVVIKVSVSGLEQKFTNTIGITVLTGPDEMVFAASRKDWLFKSLWPLSVEKAERLASTRQFGDELPSTVGLRKDDQGRVIDSDDNQYIMRQQKLNGVPGWWISHFHDTRLIMGDHDGLLNRVFVYGGALLFLLIISTTLWLNWFARKEIKTRKQAELDLIQATEEARHANQTKSEFLSCMSHELRTPLNAILGFGQLLELGDEKLSENQRENVSNILGAGKHLLNLIGEVLDLASIESGKMNIFLTDVSVDEVLLECVSLVRPQAASRNIELTDHVSGKGYIVQADVTRLKQVLVNLLANAVKYNCEKGCVVLDSELMDRQRLRIRVTDSGEGLTEENIARLFTPFERLENANNTEGTGIGLVITRHLVEIMGGTLGVDSNPGEGSTFWVEFALVKHTDKESCNEIDGGVSETESRQSGQAPALHALNNINGVSDN